MSGNVNQNTAQQKQAGNAVVIVLVVLVVIAVGALAYLSGQMAAEKTTADKSAQTTEQDVAANEAGNENTIEIEPGNPVVANVDGQDITRSDVLAFIQNMPENVRQLPVDQLFRLAQNQVVNARIINKQVEKVNLDKDPKVKARLEEVKKNIVRNVYLENQIEEGLTEERMQQAYEQYKANFPKIEEARARHILVEDKKIAKDLIKQINDGADFAELARENSTDGTAENGGDLGYFTQSDVVPAFGDAAFALETGAVSQEPVETEFGYHVVKLEDKRQRPVPEFEQVRPFLEAQLRQAVLDNLIVQWRAGSDITLLDINGKPLGSAPAAGDADAQ